MSDVLIKGMKMPEEGYHHTITIYSDGTVATGRANDYEAISVPPHGRGIDADALKASLMFAEQTVQWAVPALRAVLIVIDEMPTIIPAERVNDV